MAYSRIEEVIDNYEIMAPSLYPSKQAITDAMVAGARAELARLQAANDLINPVAVEAAAKALCYNANARCSSMSAEAWEDGSYRSHLMQTAEDLLRAASEVSGMTEVRDIPRKGLATDAIERALDHLEAELSEVVYRSPKDQRQWNDATEDLAAARAELRDIAIAAQQERVGQLACPPVPSGASPVPPIDPELAMEMQRCAATMTSRIAMAVREFAQQERVEGLGGAGGCAALASSPKAPDEAGNRPSSRMEFGEFNEEDARAAWADFVNAWIEHDKRRNHGTCE